MTTQTANRYGHLTPTISEHFKRQMKAKGFDPRDVIAAWRSPEKITPVRKYPGQWRIIGNGLAIVGEPLEAAGEFRFITVYLDGVLTPPRADQTDAAGIRFRERWANGQGRG